jgi:hypothetical protein
MAVEWRRVRNVFSPLKRRLRRRSARLRAALARRPRPTPSPNRRQRRVGLSVGLSGWKPVLTGGRLCSIGCSADASGRTVACLTRKRSLVQTQYRPPEKQPLTIR